MSTQPQPQKKNIPLRPIAKKTEFFIYHENDDYIQLKIDAKTTESKKHFGQLKLILNRLFTAIKGLNLTLTEEGKQEKIILTSERPRSKQEHFRQQRTNAELKGTTARSQDKNNTLCEVKHSSPQKKRKGIAPGGIAPGGPAVNKRKKDTARKAGPASRSPAVSKRKNGTLRKAGPASRSPAVSKREKGTLRKTSSASRNPTVSKRKKDAARKAGPASRSPAVGKREKGTLRKTSSASRNPTVSESKKNTLKEQSFTVSLSFCKWFAFLTRKYNAVHDITHLNMTEKERLAYSKFICQALLILNKKGERTIVSQVLSSLEHLRKETAIFIKSSLFAHNDNVMNTLQKLKEYGGVRLEQRNMLQQQGLYEQPNNSTVTNAENTSQKEKKSLTPRLLAADTENDMKQYNPNEQTPVTANNGDCRDKKPPNPKQQESRDSETNEPQHTDVVVHPAQRREETSSTVVPSTITSKGSTTENQNLQHRATIKNLLVRVVQCGLRWGGGKKVTLPAAFKTDKFQNTHHIKLQHGVFSSFKSAGIINDNSLISDNISQKQVNEITNSLIAYSQQLTPLVSLIKRTCKTREFYQEYAKKTYKTTL